MSTKKTIVSRLSGARNRVDGTMRLFMLEPQHGTSSDEEVDSDTAQDQPETVESDVRSRFGNRD